MPGPARLPARPGAAALAALAAIASAVAFVAAAGPAAAPAAAAALDTPRLHAAPDPRHGGRIVDARGREVLLRGVNVVALVDYWKGTRFPVAFPFGARDSRRIAGIGWNAVRLALSWSRIEPRPGVYDDAYLAQAAGVVRALRRQGVYTILDMHQDAWGPALVGRPDEGCTPPARPGIGWDGAPAWATLDGGARRCFTGQREVNPAVQAAWQAFLGDARGPGGVGVRARFLAMWRHVARRFAATPSVAGFDVVNEPNAFSPQQQAALSRLHAAALRAIRSGERDGRGFHHLVFFEPSVLFSATGSGAPPPFRHDRDVVYAPHVYTGAFDGGAITRAAFATAVGEARRLGGAPVLSGEWGSDPDRAGPRGDGYFVRHQRFQDDLRMSATFWVWRESCGSPEKYAEVSAGKRAEVWGPFEVDCRDNTVTGERRDLVRELERAYVRAAPGELERLRYDDATGRLEANGARARRGAELVVSYPRAKHGVPEIRRARGLRRVRVRRAGGGQALVTARTVAGSWSLALSPR